MSDIRVWIADLVDIHPADPELSMIATNQPVVSKLDHDAAMKGLRDENQRLKEVLKPFAKMGEALDEREFVNLYERSSTDGTRLRITMQHLKAAHIAMQS